MLQNKKKLLFVSYGLGIGGIETCLVNLINALPEEQFQIDVLLMNPQYKLKSRIKRSIQYLDSFNYVMNTTDTMNSIYKHGGIIKNLGKFISYCKFRIRVKLRISSWKTFKKLPVHYDIAVAYSQNDYSPYYVIDKVSASRKVMWYHNGAYEADKKKYERDKKYYNKFDYIVAVSSDCRNILKDKFNFPDRKLIVLRNICDAAFIRNKAKEFTPSTFKDGVMHIVTVGRLTKEKGANLAVEVCRLLCEEKANIQWHWVGDGNQREKIKKKIQEYKLQEKFILEGNQTNPYPFIKNADIYVQSSYYEAYSTTITEAKILGKPIITTDVGGMRDQIINGDTGIIVKISENELKEAILKLIKNEKLRQRFSNIREKRECCENYLKEYYMTIFA